MTHMTIKGNIYLTLLLSLMVVYSATAQDGSVTDRDFEIWSSASLSYKVSKVWKITLEEQLRLKTNASEIDQYFTEIGTEYELWKQFSIGLGLRYSRKNDTKGNIQGFEDRLRYNIDLGHKFAIERFDISNRLRFQSRNELGMTKEEGDITNNRLRLKTSIAYNIKKWKLDPKFSAEIFRLFEEGEEEEFDKFRLTLGTGYDFKKFGKVGVFYRFERDINTDQPKLSNILGLKYAYSL